MKTNTYNHKASPLAAGAKKARHFAVFLLSGLLVFQPFFAVGSDLAGRENNAQIVDDKAQATPLEPSQPEGFYLESLPEISPETEKPEISKNWTEALPETTQAAAQSNPESLPAPAAGLPDSVLADQSESAPEIAQPLSATSTTSTEIFVPQNQTPEPEAEGNQTALESLPANSQRPYEHLALSNQEIASVLPSDLANPIVVGTKQFAPQLELKLVIQGVNETVSASTATDTIVYYGAFENTDLEYKLSGKSLKENIVLRQAGHPEIFSYKLNLSQYDYKQVSSSTIELYRKGRQLNPLFKLFTISAPVMSDAAGSVSTDILLFLEGETLTVRPDQAWLKDAVYPVYVDPSVEVSVLNLYSHPVAGEYWTIDFVTLGQEDLVITPADEATLEDMQFAGLTCDGLPASFSVDGFGRVEAPGWNCEGLGQAKFYVKKTGHHHMLFAFGGSQAEAFNGNNVWVGGVDSNWETAGNWSLGTAPAAGDDVVISATSAPITIRLNASSSINSLTLGSLAATTTLSFEYDAINSGALSIAGDLAVNAMGTLTHKTASYTPDGAGLVEGRISLSVGGNATIDSGGEINTYGKGYWYSNGPGKGKGFIDPGGSGYRSSGASHGGIGGFTGAEYMTPAGMVPTAADTYGDMYAPTDLGSGGGSATDFPPGASQFGSFGGGAVRLDVAGTTTIDGIITADAEGIRNNHRGGGAGGSVYITTGGLAGAGTVSANGGAFSLLTGNSGGGGGGRIAVYYENDNSSISFENHGGAWYCSFFVTGKEDDSRNCPTSGQYGGGQVGGFGMASSTAGSFGGAGTIYKKSLAQSFGDLTLDNNNGLEGAKNENLDTQSMDLVYEDALGKTPLLADIELDSLTVKNGAYLFLDTGFATTVSSTAINLERLGTLDVASGTSFSYASLNWASGMIVYGGGNFDLLTENQDLVIPSSSPESLYPTTLVMKIPGDSRTYDDVVIGGILKSAYNRNVSSTTPGSGLYKIDWTITGNLTIDYTGAIDQTGRGFSGNQGPGAGMSSSTSASDTGRFGAGGSYGGAGGATTTFPNINAGPTYGSSTAPTDLGSGGGGIGGASYSTDFYEGGFGGGAVILNVAGTTTLNGLIAADGESFPGWSSGSFGYCNYNRGAGSGGSVYLTTGHLSGYGKISASGGDVCGGSGRNGGGAGGGGRIAVYSGTHNDTISLNARGGGYRSGLNRRQPLVQAYDAKGSAGTIYPVQSSSTVVTNAATGVGNTSATLNGDLTQLGYFDIVDHGFVWAVDAMPYLGIDTSLAQGGTATSSGDPDEGFPAPNAFANTGAWSPYHNDDYSNSPTGTPTGPWYLQYDLATPTVVNAFYIRGGTGYYGARHYELRGWNGSAWVALQGDSHIERWDDYPTNFYAYNNTTAYSKYRLYIGSRYKNFTPSTADDGIYIYQLAFYNRRVPQLNLAAGATASASSSALGYTAQNAVDGYGWAYDANIATGGTATTSSERGASPASNAFDSDEYTYWVSEHNLAIGGTASGSQEEQAASNAFDGDVSTSWITNNVYGSPPALSYPADLEYDLGTSTVVNLYTITAPASNFGDPPYPESSPNTWDFEGWNGSSWVTLDSRSGETGWYENEIRTYGFSNSTGYTKYRLSISANDGADYVAVGEVAFYDAASGLADWLEYELPQTATVTGYSILYDASSYDASSSPNTWDFEAWDSASSSWIVLDSVSGENNWYATTTKVYSFSNSEAYDRYRINISANNGGVANSIGEVRLFSEDFPQNNLQITLAVPRAVAAYEIVSDPAYASLPASSTPKAWDFEAWDTASSSWVNLQSVTGQTDWTASSQYFSFINTSSYSEYRFVFTAQNGDSSNKLYLNQIRFFEGMPATGQATLNAAAATGAFSSTATGLSSGTTYHYRAYAVDHAGNAYYGADQTFTTTGSGNNPPNPPDTLAPANYVDGSWGNDNTPSLTFNLSDPDVADTVRYQIQISATSSFSSLLVDYTSALAAQGAFGFTVGQATGTGAYSSGYAGQTLPDSANYYWRAMTYDNSAATSSFASANSGSIAFRVDTAAPVPGALSFSSVATTTIGVDISGASDSLSGLAAAAYVFYNTTSGTNSGATSSASWLNTGLSEGSLYSYLASVADLAGNVATTVPASTTTPGQAPPPSGGGGGSLPPGPLAANYYCMVINNDEPETVSRLVDLNFSTDASVTKVVVANNPSFADAREFSNYTGTIIGWDLCGSGACPAGDYTVYAKFYSSTSTGEQVSSTLSDDIAYLVVDTSKPPVVSFRNSSSTLPSVDSAAAVEVRLSYPAPLPVSVNYSVSGGGGGSVSFLPGAQTASIILQNLAEPDLASEKTVDVVLSNPVNSVLGNPEVHGITIFGTGTIVEQPPVATSSLGVSLQVSVDGVNWQPFLRDLATNTPVSLRASVSGDASGEIFYQFFCDSDGTVKKQAVSSLPKMDVPGLCAYAVSGVYVPQVVVLRGGLSASAAAEVQVGIQGTPVPPGYCELYPSDEQCAGYCSQNPQDINCLCAENPADPACGIVPGKTFCEINPTDPACVSCSDNPALPGCSIPEPGFCQLFPQDASCLGIDPFTYCETNPADPICNPGGPICETDPTARVCQKPFCVENPTDPACVSCAQNPTAPECICAYNLNDPACSTVSKGFCELFPADPACVSCAQNPSLPGCEIPETAEPPATQILTLTLEGWLQNFAGKIDEPARQALTGGLAFAGAPAAAAIQYGLLGPGLPSFTGFLLVLLRLIQNLLAFLGLRKRRNHWGTVYDSATKQPLDPAIVELVDQKTGKVLEQSITDMTGRYGFLVRDGEFAIRPTKTHFQFPSQHILGKEDEVFDQLYHGESLFIRSSDSKVVAPNIPMDPLGFDWNQMDKQRVVKFHPWREALLRWSVNSLFYIGLVWTIFTVLVSPSLFNYFCFAFYLAVLAIQWLMPRERLWGRVYEEGSGLLLPWVILELSSAGLNVVMGRAKSGPDGRFFLKAEPGDYRLSVYQKQADGSRQLLGSAPVKVGKNRILNSDITINSQNG